MTGTFFAVVGPSGSGKDTLISRAREVLQPTGRFRFPQRYITRPAGAGGEDHIPVTPEQFAAILASGGFCLSWRAHELSYGVPAGIELELDAGRDVVVNLSRAAIDPARRRFVDARVIVVTAPTDVIAARLAARGREDAGSIAERLDRSRLANPVGSDVEIVDNGGDLEAAAHQFIGILESRPNHS